MEVCEGQARRVKETEKEREREREREFKKDCNGYLKLNNNGCIRKPMEGGWL